MHCSVLCVKFLFGKLTEQVCSTLIYEFNRCNNNNKNNNKKYNTFVNNKSSDYFAYQERSSPVNPIRVKLRTEIG